MSKKEERLKIFYEGEFATNIPDEIMDAGVALSSNAFRCWAILRRYAQRPEEDGIRECYPSMKTIAAKIGLSVGQTYKYIKELSEIGLLLDIKKRVRKDGWGVFNVYRMVNPKIWWKEVGELLVKSRKEKKQISYKTHIINFKKKARPTD